MQTLDPNLLPFYLWLMNHCNGIVEYVMINGQLLLYWPSHWPLGDPTIIVLDDSEWPGVRGQVHLGHVLFSIGGNTVSVLYSVHQ